MLLELALLFNLAGAPRTLLTGVVRDGNGAGVPNASLYLRGSGV